MAATAALKKTNSRADGRGGAYRKPVGPDAPAYDGTAALKRRSELAYDLSRFDRRTSVRTAYEAQAARPAARVRAVAKPRLLSRISLFAIVSFFMVTGLMLMIVYGYMQLNELSVNNAALDKQLSSLKNEETVMRSEIERRISLKNAEDYAENRLGMVKPEQDQVVYLDLSGSDHAEVVDEGDKNKSDFARGFSHMLGSIISFIN